MGVARNHPLYFPIFHHKPSHPFRGSPTLGDLHININVWTIKNSKNYRTSIYTICLLLPFYSYRWFYISSIHNVWIYLIQSPHGRLVLSIDLFDRDFETAFRWLVVHKGFACEAIMLVPVPPPPPLNNSCTLFKVESQIFSSQEKKSSLK